MSFFVQFNFDMKVNEIILDYWFYLEELPLVRLNITKKHRKKTDITKLSA